MLNIPFSLYFAVAFIVAPLSTQIVWASYSLLVCALVAGVVLFRRVCGGN